jgi:hypothetical protein
MENADLREGFLKLHLILFNIILSTLLTIKKKKNFSLFFFLCVSLFGKTFKHKPIANFGLYYSRS